MTLYLHSKCAVAGCTSKPKGWPAQNEALCDHHCAVSVVLCRDGVQRSRADADAWNASLTGNERWGVE